MKHLPLTVTVALTGLAVSMPGAAADLQVTVEIPRLNVAEYHRPYVAIWLEDASGNAVSNLSTWYQQTDGKEGPGTKWLPDLRQWWRKSGRTLKLPVDGVSGPTKPAGKHSVKYSAARLAKVAPGNYVLVIEAVREVGGRELVKVPITWPKAATATASGKTELGNITVKINP